MNLKQHDDNLRTADWLAERDMPVAIVLTEELEPSGGPDSIVFPPTFAFRKEAYKQRGNHPYAFTTIRDDMPAEEAAKNGVEANICDLDTFGSQANRMEPAFKRAPLSSLVPQFFVKAKAQGRRRRSAREPARCWSPHRRRRGAFRRAVRRRSSKSHHSARESD